MTAHLFEIDHVLLFFVCWCTSTVVDTPACMIVHRRQTISYMNMVRAHRVRRRCRELHKPNTPVPCGDGMLLTNDLHPSVLASFHLELIETYCTKPQHLPPTPRMMMNRQRHSNTDIPIINTTTVQIDIDILLGANLVMSARSSPNTCWKRTTHHRA